MFERSSSLLSNLKQIFDHRPAMIDFASREIVQEPRLYGSVLPKSDAIVSLSEGQTERSNGTGTGSLLETDNAAFGITDCKAACFTKVRPTDFDLLSQTVGF